MESMILVKSKILRKEYDTHEEYVTREKTKYSHDVVLCKMVPGRGLRWRQRAKAAK